MNQEANGLSSRDRLMVGIIISGGFITVLNQTVMSPSLPTIMREFSITAASGQWLTSIFLLVNGLMIPVTAFLIARFSTRQLFMAAMTCFTAGSALAAVSANFPLLLCARVMQALGAGIMLPFTSVMLMLIFPKSRRGFALGISGVVIGLAPAFGPTVAGWIVDTFGWRYIFALIAPLAVVVMAVAGVLLRNLGERADEKLDFPSLLYSTLGFGGLLFGFSQAGSLGWTHPLTLASIAVGAVFILFFAQRELSILNPMLNLRIMGNPTFTTSTIIAAVVSAGITVAAVITPIYLQNVLGLSALDSGLLLMPGALLMAGLSPVSGMLFDRFGPRALAIGGLSAMAAGTAMLGFVGIHTTVLYIGFAYTLRMAGTSLVNMPVNTWGLNSLPNRRIAHGNAINSTARQVAGSMGTGVLVTVMMTTASGFANPASSEATVAGINDAFRWATALTVLALVIAIARVGIDPDDNPRGLSSRKTNRKNANIMKGEK